MSTSVGADLLPSPTRLETDMDERARIEAGLVHPPRSRSYGKNLLIFATLLIVGICYDMWVESRYGLGSSTWIGKGTFVASADNKTMFILDEPLAGCSSILPDLEPLGLHEGTSKKMQTLQNASSAILPEMSALTAFFTSQNSLKDRWESAVASPLSETMQEYTEMSSELALDLSNLFIEMGAFTTIVAEEVTALVTALETAQSEDECLHQLPISKVVNQTAWIVRPGSDAVAKVANHLDHVEHELLIPVRRLKGCIASSEKVETQLRDVDELKRQQLQSMRKEKKAVEEEVDLPLEQPSESDTHSFRYCLWKFCFSGLKSPRAQARLAKRYEESIRRRQAQAARRTGNIKRLDDNISLLEADDKDFITPIQAPLQIMMETLQAFRSALLETKKVLHHPKPTADAFFIPKAHPGTLSDLADQFRQNAQWIEGRAD